MPLVDRNYSFPEGETAAPPFNGIDLTPHVPEVPSPGFLETAGAALRQSSDIVSPFASYTFGVDDETPDEGFDIGEELKGTPYENRREFVGVRNRRAMEATKLQLDQEVKDRGIIEAAGWMGTALDFGAGMASWTLAIPGGALVKSAKGGFSVAKSAATVGAAAAIGGAASEATLQASQVSRPMSESVATIGSSFLLGGVLGGVASRLTRSEWSDLVTKTDAAFRDPSTVPAYSGAASVGAASVERGSNRLKDEGMFKRLYGLNEQDPMIRTQLSPLSAARDAVRDMAETPLEIQANREGFATSEGGAVETRMKMWNAPLYRSVRSLDDAYARYFFEKEAAGTFDRMTAPFRGEVARKRGTADKLTFKEFKDEVSRAMSSDDTHPIPQVQETAKAFREDVFDRGRKAAIEAGLFDKNLNDVPSAGYLHRVYNREKIIARRTEFKQILTDYLENGRVSAERRESELQAANLATQIDAGRRRLAGLGKQLSSSTRRIDKAEAAGTRQQGQIVSARSRLQEIRNRARDVQDAEASKPLRDAIKRAQSGRTLPLPKTPVLDLLKDRGGVLPGSTLAQELTARGITSKTRPGLFRKPDPGRLLEGPRGAADNLVGSEHEILADNLPVDENGYVSEADILSAVDEELAGNPLRTNAERDKLAEVDGPASALREELDALGISLDQPEEAILRDLARAEDEAGRFASFDDIPMIEVPEALEADLEGLEDFYVSQTRTELEARYAEMKADIAKRGEAAAMSDPRFAKRYKDTELSLSRLKDTAEGRKFARTVMRRDYAARAGAWQREATALDDLVKQFDAMPEDVRSAKRVGIARDYATVSRDLAAKKGEQARLTKTREDHALVGNTERVHDLDGRLRIVEQDVDRLAARHAKLTEIVERSGKGSASELEDIRAFTNLSRQDLEGISDEVIDAILKNSDGRILLPGDVGGGSPRGALKARTLRIDDAAIDDFLERDIEAVARIYTRSMSADVELTRKFGSVDMAETVAKINDEANARIDLATTEKERRLIQKEREDALRDVQGMRDRLRGAYKLPDDPDGILLRTGRVARQINFQRLLGRSFLAAFSDVAKPILNYGLTSVFRDGFIPMIRNLQSFKLAGVEARDSGTALDLALDSRAMAMADIVDDYGRGNKFERAVNTASSRFGVVSLLAPWTAMVKQFSSLVIINNFLRAVDQVAAGTATAKTLGRLGSANISADLARRISSEFKAHGKVDGGSRWANTGAWTDREAVDAFRSMLVREVDRTIVTVGQDKPLWMSTEQGKLIGQFKSFGVASVQKTLFVGLQQRDAAALSGVLSMLGFGCESAWNKDPVLGVIGVQTGPL